MNTNDIRVSGRASAYRLYDVGYGIDVDRATALLGDRTRGRRRPARIDARGLQVRNPPLVADLGRQQVTFANGQRHDATVSAHLFEFGVISLQLTFTCPARISWDAFRAFGRALDATNELISAFDDQLRMLLDLIAPSVERQRVADVQEDYLVFRVDRLERGDERLLPTTLTDAQISPLLLGEERSLSETALRDLLQHRFSYYADDLTIITWDNAMVMEPRSDDYDVEYVIEFANAQLLELRLYDAELDAQLPALYDRIAAERRRARPLPTHRFRGVLTELQTRVADVTEVIERAENAFKVLDDVYLARVYGAALELFRERAWREGIERKLRILRDTYSMLNAESQAARAELLEIAIVLLFVFEVVMGFIR